MTARRHPRVPAELPAGLLRPDGSVLVPSDVAGELLAAAVRDLTARARRDGLTVSDRALRVLQALHEAAERHDTTPPAPAGTGAGTHASASPTVITTTHAADLLGCTDSYVRRLCRAGRLTGERVGPLWLIDQASLNAYRYRRNP